MCVCMCVLSTQFISTFGREQHMPERCLPVDNGVNDDCKWRYRLGVSRWYWHMVKTDADWEVNPHWRESARSLAVCRWNYYIRLSVAARSALTLRALLIAHCPSLLLQLFHLCCCFVINFNSSAHSVPRCHLLVSLVGYLIWFLRKSTAGTCSISLHVNTDLLPLLLPMMMADLLPPQEML